MNHNNTSIRYPLAALLAGWLVAAAPASAETTPPQPAAAQPTLPTPGPLPVAPRKPGSPVVEELVQSKSPLTVRRKPARMVRVRHHRVARASRVPRALDRPALSGVELVAPLPPPGEPPHITVPMPAFPLDSIATSYTTPPPPIVCHRTRRDPNAPDPHLYREFPVECMPDNP